MDLNPNHPTTSKIHDHWHKIAAILVNRCADKRTLITLAEIERLAAEGLAITIKDVAVGIELRLVSMAEGEKLARQEGGLPA